MIDIDRELRDYASQMEEIMGPMHVESFRGERRVRPRPVRRGLAVALSAAAMVTLIIVAVAVLDPFGSDAPFIDEPTTGATTTTTLTTSTTEAAATTTTEAPTPAQVTMTWTRIESEAFGGSGEQWIRGIVAGDNGLVAVGGDGSEGDQDAAVWYSSDGRTWTKVPHDEALFGGPGDQYMMAITKGGPGFVAVGESFTEDGPVGIAAVWTSPDGITWSRVPHDEAAFGGEEQVNVFMKDVTAFGSGLVAVGLEVRDGEADAVAWISPDGFTWERVPHDETVFGGAQDQVMWAVAPAGPGLVAVGQAGDSVGAGGPGQPAAVWVSTDGRDWSRVPEQAALLSGFSPGGFPLSGDWARMDDVVIGGPGLVAVGRVGRCENQCDEEGAAWTSSDGITWQRSHVDKAAGFFSSQMHGVVQSGDLLVGVGLGGDHEMGGRFGTAYATGSAVVWTSADGGETWLRQPHSGSAFGLTSEGPVLMRSVIEFDSGLIAAGTWESDAAVWIATIEE